MSLYFLEQISNECNSCFTNEGPTLAGNIQPVSTGYTEYLMFFNDAISSSNLTTEKLEITLKPLKRNMAAGQTPLIQTYFWILKMKFQGIFTNMLKQQKSLTPLFKSGDPENVTNYRLISVAPVFSKILERIMYHLIYKQLIN